MTIALLAHLACEKYVLATQCRLSVAMLLPSVAPHVSRLLTRQGCVGSTLDCRTHQRHAELGGRVQEVVPVLQAAHVLRERQGAQEEAGRLVEAECLPCLHHLLHPRPPGQHWSERSPSRCTQHGLAT